MFRPMPVLTVLTLAAVALLVTLGVWQSQRASQKADAIEAWRAAPGATVHAAVADAVCADDPFAHGVETARLDPAVTARAKFYGGRDGQRGWRVLAPVDAPCLGAGVVVLTEVDFETYTGAALGPSTAVVVAPPPASGAFTAQNTPAAAEFYRWDPQALGAALGLSDGARVHDAFWLTAYSDALPERLARVPPSRHVGYAVTWFAMAIALIAVYVAFHARAGRIGRQAD